MKVLTQDQYSPEWWNARRGLPTSSQFSRICTPSKGEYIAQASGYMHELIASLYDPSYGEVDDYKSAAMKNGTIMEPEARRFYEFERDAKVDDVGLCCTDDSKLGASPDGLVGDDGCLEIKSPLHKTQVAYLLDGDLPREYRCQVHGHLIVTGRDWCDFISYARGLPHLLVRVTPGSFTDSLRECLDQFCDEYAKAREQFASMYGPPPDFGVDLHEDIDNDHILF